MLATFNVSSVWSCVTYKLQRCRQILCEMMENTTFEVRLSFETLAPDKLTRAAYFTKVCFPSFPIKKPVNMILYFFYFAAMRRKFHHYIASVAGFY
jgi:hypothetical protein